jgi:wyosine [tRNA(Phe)-imidazoG37] synthetase (radical SAM superfamily)
VVEIPGEWNLRYGDINRYSPVPSIERADANSEDGGCTMHVYGPVPSRRLGRSLGVSPIPPKTCSYSCVYCQLGRTTSLRATRKSFFHREDMLAEIVDRARTVTVDYITFVGDGEPTLCLDLGWLIHQIKKELPLPVAVITNGSLFSHADVRSDLSETDVVMPTLDAGDERSFRTINRPHKTIAFEVMLQGLRKFRARYLGQIWLEVMLVAGLNDTIAALHRMRDAVLSVAPDRVYVTVPTRPPAEKWVRPPSPANILVAQRVLGETIPLTESESGDFGVENFIDAHQAILEIGSRHPLRREQALDIEQKFAAPGTVEQMLTAGDVVEVRHCGERYVLPRHFVRRDE